MKATSILPILCSVGLLLASAQAAYSDVVADYTFASGSAASTVNGVDGSTAGDFTSSPNNTGGNNSNSINPGQISSSTGTAYFSANNTWSLESSAISDGTYFSFTITPAAGTTLQLTTLTFTFGASPSNQGSGGYSASLSLQTSPTNFATAGDGVNTGVVTATIPTPSGSTVVSTPATETGVNGTGGTVTLSSVPATENTYTTSVTVDLSALSSITATTTLRIYFYDNDSQSSEYDRIGNVVLNADATAIPEPKVYALAIGTCAGLLVLVRRRKKACA